MAQYIRTSHKEVSGMAGAPEARCTELLSSWSKCNGTRLCWGHCKGRNWAGDARCTGSICVAQSMYQIISEESYCIIIVINVITYKVGQSQQCLVLRH